MDHLVRGSSSLPGRIGFWEPLVEAWPDQIAVVTAVERPPRVAVVAVVRMPPVVAGGVVDDLADDRLRLSARAQDPRRCRARRFRRRSGWRSSSPSRPRIGCRSRWSRGKLARGGPVCAWSSGRVAKLLKVAKWSSNWSSPLGQHERPPKPPGTPSRHPSPPPSNLAVGGRFPPLDVHVAIPGSHDCGDSRPGRAADGVVPGVGDGATTASVVFLAVQTRPGSCSKPRCRCAGFRRAAFR